MLNQVSTVGRSVSYTLLPSEIVSQVIVHKSSEAKIVEGGVAGSVDIITRKPLEFRKRSPSRHRSAASTPTCPKRPTRNSAA